MGGVATRLPLPRGSTYATLNGINRCGAIVGIAGRISVAPRAAIWKKRGCD